MNPGVLLPAILALFPGALLSQAKEEAPPPTRVKVLKIWASDQPTKAETKADSRGDGKAGAKEEKAEAPRDELKEYRKRLEAETKKKHFELEGKPDLRPVEPEKTLTFPLIDDLKLQILPRLKGEEKEGKVCLLLLTILQKDQVKRKFELNGQLPLIYLTPIRSNDRSLVVIVQKVVPPPAK